MTLALAAPHADERQEREHAGVQVRPESQIRGVLGQREIGQRRDVASRRVLCALFGSRYRTVAAATDNVRLGVVRLRFGARVRILIHGLSVTSRYTTYSENQVIRMAARTRRTSKKMTTGSS